ncbi:hypothetical protein B0O80DRAFT_492080 [Mortierella sp. GBAus27b]|nr:hypothetical protein BGX31_003104 [Mortierella sp. GBA43]KAI8362891.1 hypothetical protein B0O80DRAFT_492080 [Mortierella sp. GBAus27b]
MTVDDTVVQKLWKLTNELTAQLVFNRNATLELKQQLADLQAKTAQNPGAISISPDTGGQRDQGPSDISLRIANERLMEENSQLQEQLHEYERWMEYIMTKFRLQNFAMAQSRKEAMHEAYKMAEQEGELSMRLQEENTVLQARLADVGAVARKAINDEYYNTEAIIETLEIENQGLREMLGVASEDFNPLAARLPRNRVSFPSTGSYVASSGSDREQPHGHGFGAPPSPPEQTIRRDLPSSFPMSVSGSSSASKPATGDSTPVVSTGSATSTASNSTVTSPVIKSARRFSTEPMSNDTKDTGRKPAAASRKKSEENVPSAGSSKGGMTINTSVGPKKTSSGSGSNANTAGGTNANSASGSTATPKTKKTNRKQQRS